jgi:hypothetical protein
MKCEEFRRIGRTDMSLLSSTRAERACCIVHIRQCIECRKWYLEGEADPQDTLDPLESFILARVMMSQDILDPEFREIVTEGKQ